MIDTTQRQRFVRAGLAVMLGYVLALHLVLVALAGSAMAAESLNRIPGELASAAMLCAPSAASDRAGDSSIPAHGHDGACCTAACFVSAALPAPPASDVRRPLVTTRAASSSMADLVTRPARAPPSGGCGPRAPPFDLI